MGLHRLQWKIENLSLKMFKVTVRDIKHHVFWQILMTDNMRVKKWLLEIRCLIPSLSYSIQSCRSISDTMRLQHLLLRSRTFYPQFVCRFQEAQSSERLHLNSSTWTLLVFLPLPFLELWLSISLVLLIISRKYFKYCLILITHVSNFFRSLSQLSFKLRL